MAFFISSIMTALIPLPTVFGRRVVALSILLAIFGITLASKGFAQAALTSDAKWTAFPSAIRPSNGNYPASVNIDLFPLSCARDKNTGKWTQATDNFTIIPTGAGVTIKSVTADDCKLLVAATIDPSIQPGEFLLNVGDQPPGGTSSDAGYATLILVDSAAGATPSTPEADVQWKVLSQHACSDAFGNHVAKVFYCVQVTVGNNSGYKLQIVSVGFQSPNPLAGVLKSPDTLIQPNTSYQTTRAVAQAGQTTTARNLIVNGLGATGLIMAAFTPYFHNPISSTKWSTGASIVSGTFTAAIGLVAPDLTVRELTALDDQSLQDGKTIGNNSVSPPFDVFVDKKDTVENLALLAKTLGTPTTDAQRVISDALAKCRRDKFQSCDPLLVKLALGEVVITGDKIDYIQRVVIASSPTTQPSTSPSITSGQTLTVSADGSPHSIAVTGQNLGQITGVAPSTSDPNLSGISVSNVTPTSVTVSLTVQSADAGKTVTLVLQSPSGNVPISLSAH